MRISSPRLATKPLRLLRLGILGFAIVIIATAMADTMLRRAEARHDAIVAAAAAGRVLLQSLDEHLIQSFEAADRALALAVDVVERNLDYAGLSAEQLHEELRRVESRGPQLRAIAITDATGQAIAHSQRFPLHNVSLSQSDYFDALRSPETPQPYIGALRISRISGLPVIPLARRLTGPNGQFAGVAVAGISPDYYERFYGNLLGDTSAVLDILTRDGAFVARAGGSSSETNPSMPLPAAKHIVSRSVAGAPFILNLHLSEDEVLRNLRDTLLGDVLRLLVFVVAVSLLTSLLVAATYKGERMANELLESEERQRHFAEATSDWYWEMGPDLRFTHFSGRYRELLGIDPVAVIGKTREELLGDSDTPERWQEHLDDLKHRRPFRGFTYQPRLPSGKKLYCRLSGKPFFAEDGTFLGYRGTGQEVTTEVLAEQEARRARQLLFDALEQSENGFVLYDADDRLMMWNSAYVRIHASTADLITAGQRFETILHAAVARRSVPEALGRESAWLEERLAAHRAARSVHQQQASDGRWIRIQETRLADGGYLGIHIDVSDTVRREAELRELSRKDELLVAAISTTRSGIVITDPTLPDNPIIYANPGFTALTGYSAEEVLGRNCRFLQGPGTDRNAISGIRQAVVEGRPFGASLLNYRKDGRPLYLDVNISPVLDGDGRVTHFVGVQTDVTALVLAKEDLREREEQLRRIAANIPGVIYQRVGKPGGAFRYTYVSDRCLELSGYTAEEWLAEPQLIRNSVVPEFRAAFDSAKHAALKTLQPAEVQFQVVNKSGARRWWRSMFRPRELPNGDIQLDGVVFDVTERVHAEEKLRDSEEKLRSLASNLPGVIFQRVIRPDGSAYSTYVSERCKEITGYTAAEWANDRDIARRHIDESHLPRFRAAMRKARCEALPVEIEYPCTTKAGEKKWFQLKIQPRKLATGDLVWDGVLFDVTRQKLADGQKAELEAQLRQAQKIEAIGTLAGGIAHDINNTLVPIVALSRLSLDALPDDHSDRESLQTVLDAAYRARDLIAEILAFSRKEMPRTEPVRLGEIIGKAHRLLAATLGPNVTIALDVADDMEPVQADGNQLVQVIMNLCTNAAHAIGRKNGEIAITVDAVPADHGAAAGLSGGIAAGGFARVRVSDNGCGMDRQTLQRVFEPFFTTKGVGEGTGLGLSVVHGIIRSHRGVITAESEVGRGTTFTILLPFALTADQQVAAA